jgi:D-alanyl-D-alanine carboxypeptidase/D-alanyl-D-alanine-endopeptidase (penicillin-binding protein 4)
LIIKGYGDPAFASELIHGKGHFNAILNNIVEIVSKKGIKQIEGDVLADESHLVIPPEHATWQWMDLGNYYGSGAWALNAHDNFFYITFKQTTSIGQIPEIVKIEPEIPGLILKNEITTALPNTGDNAYVYGAPFQEHRIIRGTIPAGTGLFTIKASIPHPAKFLTFHIIKSLESKGISVKKQTLTTPTDLEFQVINTWNSPELHKLTQLANKESNNMICEALYHEIGVKMKNSHQKYDGKVAMSEWLSTISHTNVPVFIEDGSGLSMKNGISPISMTSFLYEIQKIKDFDAWKSSLPKAGKEGTVKSIGKNITSATLQLKSGSLSRVRCYAGYVQKTQGDSYIVSLMINQHGLRSSEITALIDTFFTNISK